MTDVTITRRSALLGAAALPLVASALPANTAQAAAPMMGVDNTPFARFKLGEFEVTTLLAGAAVREEPHKIFGLNVDDTTFDKAAEDAFIPNDMARFFFTPTVVNTGSSLVLFDTGLPGDTPGVVSALAGAGYTPDQVDTVVLTHMHPDHIGGMMTGGKPTFPNASYVIGDTEYNFWKGKDNRIGKMMDGMVVPIEDKAKFIKPGDEVTGGITAVEAFGHTPGHMTFQLESGGQNLMLMADAANHYVFSLAHPDWEVSFDADKAAAAATRRRLLTMLAEERMPFVGYHMPFPALGYVEKRGEGFHYVPASYQLEM
ncbi:MBL fold metallo-hydrolase [Ahrensia sp. R2A130]|uniref:MBL fold metallo-hydrolase n=1 Tax=Ahrensia sp. R2A130 TaxID=744979 RepID=UPI0001E09BFC|nr:MBL fold metallo-hydrolase [Ahrensia sp. R2A130]EFL90027.1 metallo-beta-lactamase superfamily protein [Ahrensia sp. R2A130]